MFYLNVSKKHKPTDLIPYIQNMIHGSNIYLFITIVLFTSCSNTKQLFSSAEFEAHHVSSPVDQRFLKDGLVRFLDFSAFRDTVLHYEQKDSIVLHGGLFPGTTYRKYSSTHEMEFGKDHDKCMVHYTLYLDYELTGRSLAYEVVDIASKKQVVEKNYREDRLVSAKVIGEISYHAYKKAIPFIYENYGGQIQSDSISFILKPVNQDNHKTLQTTIAVQLEKAGIVHGIIHHFTGLSKKKIFLYTKSGVAEQMLVAAYFAVIAVYL